MFDALKTAFLNSGKLMLYIFLALSPFILSMIGFYVIYYRQGLRMKRGVSVHKMRHGSIIERLFWDFPKQFMLDKFNADPDDFKPFGFRMITGEQGKGKTITLVYLLLKYQEMYPFMKTMTNFAYKFEDKQLNQWQDMLQYSNGKYGYICVLDEVQNWFSSLQSKDFPPEMLGEITQQRKQKKLILGTTQVFTRCAKPIREQTYLIYEPVTLFGCLTFVKKLKPQMDENATVTGYKFKGFFFFVHTPKIRNAYDTYKKIEKYVEQGFKPASEQLSALYNSQFILP